MKIQSGTDVPTSESNKCGGGLLRIDVKTCDVAGLKTSTSYQYYNILTGFKTFNTSPWVRSSIYITVL